MTLIATKSKIPSDVVCYEYNEAAGFCRKEIPVDYVAALELGSVLINEGDDTYRVVVAADVATISGADLAVLIDPRVDDVAAGTTGDVNFVALVNGSCGVKRGGLAYGDALSDPQKADVEAELEAQPNIIRVEDTLA